MSTEHVLSNLHAYTAPGKQFDSTPTKCLSLSSITEHSQFFLFFITQSTTIASFVILWRQLNKQLFQPILLSNTAHIRHLVFGQQVHVLMNLQHNNTATNDASSLPGNNKPTHNIISLDITCPMGTIRTKS